MEEQGLIWNRVIRQLFEFAFCLEYYMKHCVDGVARLMLKRVSFFIGVAGFKKNSNGYIEEAGNLHVSMRFYRHVSAFFVSRCEQARNWNMSLLTCTRLDVVSSLCVVF